MKTKTSYQISFV